MAHKDGDAPAKTPETITKSAHYKHPQADGRVHYGDESWPILAGVVECPIEVGAAAEWPRAAEDQVKAHDKAKAKK